MANHDNPPMPRKEPTCDTRFAWKEGRAANARENGKDLTPFLP